ncbi:MAG: GGDEF domain-containing protein [Thiopseudomonas sp.]|nr:GGDEF domain-containing protein [Thiopseudomonas sp.]
MPIGLAMVNEKDPFYFRNHLFNQYFPFDPEQPLNMQTWWETICPEPDFRQQISRFWNEEIHRARAGDGIIPRQELRIISTAGTERIMLIGGITFGDQFLATFEDRTEHTQKQEQLLSMAFFDTLTGVANRRHFDQSLEAEWRRAQRQHLSLTLMMIDIDFFKQYNDTYGHPAGDACLRTVAQCIKAQLKRSHDLLARYGGEEFVCLLPDCDAASARIKAQEIFQAIADLAVPHKGSLVSEQLTISVGLASLTPDILDSDQLMRIADHNLYQAKRNGRNRTNNGQDLLC